MTLWIATPHQAERLTIPVTNMRKPPSSTTKILQTMTKAATDPSSARETIDSTVADMDLSLIK